MCRTTIVQTSWATARRFSSSNSRIVAGTRKWFETIVVGEKLCPFAPPLLKDNYRLLRVVSCDTTNEDDAVQFVASEVTSLVGSSPLDDPPDHETTLIVFDNKRDPAAESKKDAPLSTTSFTHKFTDFVRFSWKLQEHAVGNRYQDVVQLVLFHPQATHQTYAMSEDDDANGGSPSDYTIRSPYPTIHLLREEDVMKAVQSAYPNLETLPARNKEKMMQQGLQVCQRRLQECFLVNEEEKPQ